MFVKRLQPALRTSKKREWRHHAQWGAEMQQGEPGADQTHVVIERQPADADVLGTHLQGFADGANVGQQIGVSERDTFGIAGGAGRVLQQCNVAGFTNAASRKVCGQRAGSRWLCGVRCFRNFRRQATDSRNARGLQQLGDGFGAPERQ